MGLWCTFNESMVRSIGLALGYATYEALMTVRTYSVDMLK